MTETCRRHVVDTTQNVAVWTTKRHADIRHMELRFGIYPEKKSETIDGDCMVVLVVEFFVLKFGTFLVNFLGGGGDKKPKKSCRIFSNRWWLLMHRSPGPTQRGFYHTRVAENVFLVFPLFQRLAST